MSIEELLANPVAVESAPEAVCITGDLGSGKTSCLLDRARELTAEGASVLLVLPTASARESALRSLGGADAVAQDKAAGVDVFTVRDLALRMVNVACPESPWRPAVPEEISFLLVDICAAGFSSDQAKQAIAQSSSQLRAAQGLPEDAAVQKLLQLMEDYRILLPEFLDAMALAAAAPQYDHVLVDDFQNLSRAQQRMVCRLARVSVAIAGNPAQAYAKQANPQGFEEFAQAHDVVLPIECSAVPGNPRIRAFGQAVLKESPQDYSALVEAELVQPGNDDVELVRWRTSEEELANLPKVIAAYLAEHPDLCAEDIFVVAPNAAYAAALGESLHHRRLDVDTSVTFKALSGNPKRADRCEAYGALARFMLAADSADPMGMRALAGIGKPDLGAADWAAQGSQAVEVPATSGKARAYSLIGAVAPNLGVRVKSVLEPVELDSDAACFAERLRNAMCSSTYVRGIERVEVGTLADLAGQTPAVVVIAGAVEGLMPSARERDVAAMQRLFATACARAQRKLIISDFRFATEQQAQAWALPESRRRNVAGQRMATCHTTQFVAKATEAAPTAQSGEQYL